MNTVTRIRAWPVVFAVGLAISGITAFVIPLIVVRRLIRQLAAVAVH